MDESLKIIVGTLSGFVVAFLAEPIKLFFQTAIKKNNLRKGLYHEIAHNYSALKHLFRKTDEEGDEEFDESSLKTASQLIRTECYRYVISQETYLFYQIKEAATINILYSLLDMIFILFNSETDKGDYESMLTFFRKVNIREDIRSYLDSVKNSLDHKVLDKKLMIKIIGKNVYMNIFEYRA
jgi:hypothetical protein